MLFEVTKVFNGEDDYELTIVFEGSFDDCIAKCIELRSTNERDLDYGVRNKGTGGVGSG